MTAVGFAGYALAPSFGWLLASRVFAGAATANIAIAQAYIADVTPPERRAKGMGIIGAAFGLGFVLGPAMGGLLSGISLSAPGYAAAALALVNGVAAFFILPEPGARLRAPGALPAVSTSCAGRGSGVSSSSTCSLSSPSAAWRRPSRSSPRIATDSTSGT
jgi:MFS family permease